VLFFLALHIGFSYLVRSFQSQAGATVRRIAVFTLVVFLGCAPLCAQQSPSAQNPAQTTSSPAHDNTDELLKELDEETSATNSEGPAGMVPFIPGFNASLISTSQHDSTSGWSNLLTPNVAWRFNRHFSVNVEVPLYTYLNVSVITGQVVPPGGVVTNTYKLETKNFLLGDTTIAGDFELHPKFLDYNFTATLGTPTGNFPYGLGAGQYTYNLNNHFEHTFFGWLAPEIELGIGDSSDLLNSSIRKSFVAVGEQAHFQTGLNIGLPWLEIEFSSDAYEDMPLSRQTVTTITNKGKKGTVKLVKSTTQESVGEDNGFANTLDIPITRHVTLSGFYNRSLRNHEDTAGFSVVYLLRGNGTHTAR
jgi:hypothetical protein